jgi:hypothetical protein
MKSLLPYMQPLISILPKEVRLEVYKKTKQVILKNEDVFGLKRNYHLCLLLPCILWNLNYYLDYPTCDEYWSFSRTPIAFPELTKQDIELIQESEDINKVRLKLLNSYIKKLK